MQKLKIFVIHPGEGNGISYHRIWKPSLMLEEAGHLVEFHPFEDFPSKYPTIKDIDKALCEKKPDLVFMQYLSDYKWISIIFGMCKHYNIPLVTDMDDWIYDVPKLLKKRFPDNKIKTLRFLIENADGLTVSTQPLYDKYKAIRKDENIFLCPNMILPDVWQEPLKKKSNQIRIGWAGGTQHVYDMALIIRVFEQLIEEFPDIKIITTGINLKDFKFSKKNYEFIEHVPIAYWFDSLHKMNLDIGFAPIEDSEHNRCISNLKYLEYSINKIPGIYSKVYPYANSVKHNKTGILVNKHFKDWYKAFKKLILDKQFRNKLAENAYQHVIKDYNAKTSMAAKYENAFRQIIKNYGGRKQK